jgi:hypothetical protein
MLRLDGAILARSDLPLRGRTAREGCERGSHEPAAQLRP